MDEIGTTTTSSAAGAPTTAASVARGGGTDDARRAPDEPAGRATGATGGVTTAAAGRADLLAAFDAVSPDALRRRRSSKWVTYPPDVLPAWVAELDVPLAGPIRQVLHEAVDLGDTGYAEPGALPEAFATFAQGRMGWAV